MRASRAFWPTRHRYLRSYGHEDDFGDTFFDDLFGGDDQLRASGSAGRGTGRAKDRGASVVREDEGVGGELGGQGHGGGAPGDEQHGRAHFVSGDLHGKCARPRNAWRRATRPPGNDDLSGQWATVADALLRCGEPATDGREALSRREDGGIRFS